MAEFVTVAKKLATMCNYHNTRCECNGIVCPLKQARMKDDCSCGCNVYVQEHPTIAENLILNWEKPIDWSKVPIDTKILVKDTDDVSWLKRYFAKCDNGNVYAFREGATSFSARNGNDICSWECAKLYEGNKNE